MIGLDTNVLVRYLAQDDPKQSALANQLILQKLSVSRQGFVSLVVLAEVCWVLKIAYDANEADILRLAEDLLSTPQFCIENRDCVDLAIKKARLSKSNKAGFADFIIQALAQNAGCEFCVTFDKAASRSSGMRLLDSTSFA